ncbi:hypothetical protein [Ktedonosporobacter rubrisoli]|uniref:hypothetical protein n=1 Tax=Ktedonosporobacter rubrisoli TaxID=2509675 RepID=UPI001A928E34|nr:hypothetical protein [Ktedonosporobacter rubrisoli]
MHRRTTPPRPVDIAALFPELAPLARTTTRLHPCSGTPTPYDSSVGGPLLWPMNDPWPYCEELHDLEYASCTTLAEVRLQRDLLVHGNRSDPTGAFLTAEEEVLLEDF